MPGIARNAVLMISRVAFVLIERSLGWSGDHDERRRSYT